MAQLALAFAGAYIGGSLFGTAFATSMGWAIGSYLGARFFGPDLPDIEGPRISDIQITAGADYGTPITKAWGTIRLSCPLIWVGAIKERAYTTDVGGKGGGSQSITTYKYFADFAVYVCEGPVVAINKIWADGVLIYGAGVFRGIDRLLGDDSDVVQGKYNATISVHLGTETQKPDTLIESYEGVGNVSANRGICYIVIKDLALEKFGNRIPAIRVEVEASSTSATRFGLRIRTKNIQSYVDYSYTALANSDYLKNLIAINKYLEPGFKRSLRIWNFDYSGNLVISSKVTTDLNNVIIYTATVHPIINQNVVCLYVEVAGYTSRYYIMVYDLMSRRVISKKFVGYADNTYSAQGVFYNKEDGFFYIPFYRNDTTAANSDTHGVIVSYGGVLYEPDGKVDSNYYDLSGIFTAKDYYANVVNGHLYIATATSVVKMDTKGRVVGDFPRPLGTTTSATAGGDQICFDYVRNILYMLSDLGGQSRIEAFDCESETFMDMSWVAPLMPSGSTARSQIAIDSNRGILYIVVHTNSGYNYAVYGFNTISKSSAFVIDNLPDSSNSFAFSPLTFPINNGQELFVWHANQDFIKPTYDASLTLDYVVDDVESRFLDAASIDNSRLSTIKVNGAFVSKPMPAAQFIKTLMSTFFFDVSEQDGKLVSIPKRSMLPYLSISESDMTDDMSISDSSELELPTRVSLAYLDKDNDYQQASYKVDKLTKAYDGRKNNANLDVPIAFSSTEAASVADAVISELYTARRRFSFSLPIKFIELSPSDLVNITYKGTTFQALIRRVVLDAGRISCEAVRFNPQDYSSTAVPATISYKSEVFGFPAPSAGFLMDTARLDDSDDSSGVMVAAGPVSEGLWNAAYLYQSSDAINYSLISVVPDSVTYGVLLDDLAYYGNNTHWDYSQSMRIYVRNGSFSSKPELDVLNGANLLYINGELIQFVNAVYNPDGTVTLSKLLRARKGTEWAATLHPAGSMVILLDEAAVSWLDIDVSSVGIAKYYKFVTDGLNLQDATSIEFAYNGNDIKPLSPVYKSSTKISNTSSLIEWERRTRIGGEWQDYADVPLGETTEEYIVDIYDKNLVKKDTITTTSKTFTADTTYKSDILYIQQKSDRIGRGFPLIVGVSSYKIEEAIAEFSPINFFPLNELQGTTAYDFVGLDNADYVNNPIIGDNGLTVSGYSVRLDGVASHIRNQTWVGILRNVPRSMELWIKPLKSYVTNPIYCYGTNSGSRGRWFFIIDRDTNTLKLDARYMWIRGKTKIFANKTHHVVVTFPGGSITNVKFYVDGMPDETLDYYIDQSLTSDDIDTRAISIDRPAIGALFTAGNSYYFNGIIGMCAVYDRELTADEVKALYYLGRKPYATP